MRGTRPTPRRAEQIMLGLDDGRRRRGPAPTPDQDAAFGPFLRGDHRLLTARAGTGKTTTLKMLAASFPRRGVYLAFGHDVAVHDRRIFPPSVQCRTAHSFAYRALDIRALNGGLPVGHDHYLKLWQLTDPQLAADYVMLNEAQDTNPVIEDIVRRQSAQRVLVGDDAQAIYGWRGAVDALARFDGVRLPLSQSFRFGPAIADEANRWLTCLGATPWLRGTPSIPSVVGPVARPNVILCRSNTGVITEVMAAQAEGRAVGVVGGHTAIRRLAEAALTLQAEIGTDHPELYMFRTWRELQEYVEQDVAGADLKVFVALIDRYGADEILRFTEGLVSAATAEVLVSTAHKAKGLEWPRVCISTDFPGPTLDPDDADATDATDATDDAMAARISPPEARLAYVAVTRAQHVLDPGGLTWMREWVA
jgi:UvrD/REP helicase N-terminal domain/UvrD-like helicase C-terminal domain